MGHDATVNDALEAGAIVHGCVAQGFEDVRDAFVANLTTQDELGAAFAVSLDGRPVVDLWGGIANAATRQPWRRHTPVVIFSGTKGLVALCLLMLVDRGIVDPEAPVARYWPEFAAAGKGEVSVIDVAAHRARLPGVDGPLSQEDLLDPVGMAQRLAAQGQHDDARALVTYHPLTYGWLCDGLIRRVDGRSVGRFFAEEVAQPLELELSIGLTAEHQVEVANLEYGENWEHKSGGGDDSAPGDALYTSVWENPPIFPREQIPWNRPQFHHSEIPGAGAIGTARSIARLYGCLARGGEIDGIRLVSSEALSIARTEFSRRFEPLTEEPQVFGLGFELQTEHLQLGPPNNAFGHSGAGGSIHCAWPTEQVGLSYAMNRLRNDRFVDPRAQSLLSATFASIR